MENIDVIVLTGGHVPTQNKFIKQLRLRECLLNYNGIIVAWSAGSMNCADVVYAGPEFEEEAYMIKDGQQTQLCKDGEFFCL